MKTNREGLDSMGILPRLSPVKGCESCAGSGIRRVMKYKQGIFERGIAPCLCLWFKDKEIRADVRNQLQWPLEIKYKQFLADKAAEEMRRATKAA